MRARLHLRGRQIGFFREGTHELCDARSTRQLLPDTCAALDQAVAGRGGDASPAEVDLSENIEGTERSIAFDGRVSAGDGYVHDMLTIDGHDVSWRRHVLAFFQGNRYLLGSLVAHVVAQIDAGARVVDLYAGSGLFSLPVAAARAEHVVAVEGDRTAAGDLAWNAAKAAGRIEARHQAVEAFTASTEVRGATVVIDPPRTGMSKEAVAGILRLAADRIVYVSCDVATLARDARRIVDAGYAIARADGFDMFPNTPHVETVVVFNRR
jgi:23S rRNA (uracil1939-C5)-methyltransferase